MKTRVFLDANVLFSASLGGEVWSAIWGAAEAGGYQLVSSPYAVVEAQENLERKRPPALRELSRLLRSVTLVAEAEGADWTRTLLPEKDVPILAAAVAAGCRVLLTGDLRHFGPLMNRDGLPLAVMTPAVFIRSFRPED